MIVVVAGAGILVYQSGFNNKAKDTWRNVGHLKNARNIPYPSLDSSQGLPADKGAALVLYTFSGQPEAYVAARKLSALGYSNVRVLEGGIFNVKWTAANIRNHGKLNELVVNGPE